MSDISKVLINLRPNAKWIINGNSYDGIIWLDENESKPTQQEVIEETQKLQQQYELNEYQRLREKKYPSIIDQLDLLYHQGYEGWKSEIQKVKDQYPKP